MKYLIFDIETIPDPEHPWIPPEDKPDQFPPIPVHKIVSIGGMLLSVEGINGEKKKNKVLWFGNFGKPDDEVSMIRGFLQMIDDEYPDLVSYNGRGFDLPVIEHRCMRWGIQAPHIFEWHLRNRFKEEGHLDLQDLLTNFGATFRSKLSDICSALGMPGKMDVDGSKVSDMIADGKQQDVDSYCLCDVAETAWLLIRFLHLRNIIPSVANFNLIHGIKSACLAKQDKMLEKLVAETNIDRLSLEEQEDILKKSDKNLFSEIEENNDEEYDPDIPF